MLNLDHLNEQQREAALHGEGPLLILAGAGSGKTSVMTHRIARLILDEGVNPRSILAVTFTNKAAGEMRERVAKLIYGEEAMELRGDALIREMSGYGGLWILTFHSACLRILHMYAERLGYTNGFTVYDPADQKAAVKRCVEELNLDPKQFSASYALAAISGFKEDGKTPEDITAESEGQYIGPRRRDLAKLYQRYAEMLKSNNAMDFDDLLVNAVRLFQGNPDVLDYYQNRFRWIMVDEYQDTNHMQYLFVKLLAEKSGNLSVVGDDDQSIYGWRGADIRNILDFEKDFKNTRVIKLEQNYRSYANILDCANSVISGNKGRKAKALWTQRGAGDKVIYKQVYDEKEEARFIAEEVRKLSEDGRKYADMAVLTRTNAQSRTFEEAFISHGIAYRMLGQVRYYDRKEIKDMLSYMAIALNPGDDARLIRVINEPRRGIGEKSVSVIAAAAARRGVGMLELLTDDAGSLGLPPKAALAASEFAAVMSWFSEVYEKMKVSELYDELLAKTGYMRALEQRNTIEDDARVENLLEFRSAIVESEEEDPNLTLSDFLEKTALMSDVDNYDRNADAVVMMTLHSAKGLEFPVVFMPGMEEGLFPTLRQDGGEAEMEEERRLCYVGMTRAMDKLYLLRAKLRTRYGRRDYTLESRFLSEIDTGTLDPSADTPGGDLSGYIHRDYTGGWGGALPYDESEKRLFDALQAARSEVLERGAMRVTDLKPGDRVRHPKFGEGLVIESEKGFAAVMFDEAGKKKLALDIAPLEKIQ